jgi:TP901 family phage tail tape measure protein
MPDFNQEFKASIIVDATDVEIKTKAALRKLNTFKRSANEQSQIRLRLRIANFEKQIEDARKRLRQFKKEGDEAAAIQARVDIRKLQEGKNAATKSLRELKKEADGTKKSFFSLNGIVRDSIKAFGGFFIIREFTQALKGAFDASVSFESAFAGVRKTVEASEAEFAALSDELRQLAKEIPVSVEGLAGIAESAGQLGVAKEDIIDFTETVAAIAVTTNLTEQEAATAFARLANVLQIPIEEIDNLASATVELGNNFATTEKEIVEFATRIAPAGAALNLTGEELLGIGAAFTSVGIKAEAGGTAVQKVLFKINDAVNKGGKELQGFADTAGVSAGEFAELFGAEPVKALDKFVQGLEKAGPQGQAVLAELTGGSERVTAAFLAAAGSGDLFTKAIETSSLAFEENTALADEANKRYETTESQLQLQAARWNDLKIRLGDFLKEAALPTLQFFVDVAEAVGGASNKFTPFVNAVKAVGIALAAAFSLKLLTGIAKGLQGVAKSAGSLSAVLSGAATPLSSTGKALASFRATIAGLANPIGIAAAAIAGITFAVLEAKSAAEEYERAVDSLGDSLTELGNISANTAQRTEGFLEGLNELREASQAIKDVQKSLGDFNEVTSAQEERGIAAEELRAELDLLLASFGATNEEITKITEGLDLFNGAMSLSAEDMAAIEEAVTGLIPEFDALNQKFAESVERFQAGGNSLEESVRKAVKEQSKEWIKAGRNVEEFAKSANSELVKAAAETEGIGAAYNAGFRLGFSKEQIETLANVQGLSDESLGILTAAAIEAGDRGALFGLLMAAGVDSKSAEAAAAGENLGQSARAALAAQAKSVEEAGKFVGSSSSAGVVEGINANLGAISNAARAIAKILFAVGQSGQELGSTLSRTLGVSAAALDSVAASATSDANAVLAAINSVGEQAGNIIGSPGAGGGGGPSGGGGGGKSALRQAEADAKAAEKAVLDFEKSLEASNKAAGKLKDDIVDFYQEIVDSIDDAVQKQKSLEEELAGFKLTETTEFAQSAAERDIELLEKKKQLEEEILELEAQEPDLKSQERVKDLQQEINDIVSERTEIQAFLDSLTAQGVEGSEEILAAFEESKKRATLSEFEQNRLALEDTLAAKEAEIQAEIDKQKKIVEIQQRFLELQNSTEEENLLKKQKLTDLALNKEIQSAEDRTAALAELGFTDLTKDQELELLKQAATAASLDNELEQVLKQQEELLAVKEEFIELAQKAHEEATDSMIADTERLIEITKRAQQELLALNALRQTVGLGGAPIASTQNVNISQNISSNVDVEVALNEIVNTIT